MICTVAPQWCLQEAQHMQVATLFLMHRHGLSQQQVADLARDNPTLLRGLVLE
jgi:predicted metal-dependent phosphotriesterase family hydrolase